MHTLSHANDGTYKKASKSESYSCIHCGTVFSYEDMLLLHIITHHRHVNRQPLDLSTNNSGKRGQSMVSSNSRPNSLSAPTNAGVDTTRPEDHGEREPESKKQKNENDTDSSHRAQGDAGSSENASAPIRKVKTELAEESQSQTQDILLRTELEVSSTDTTQRSQPNNSEQRFYTCYYCRIIFLDRAMFHLHAGLHNHNSPWQCNICGKMCSSPLEFAAHVIHT